MSAPNAPKAGKDFKQATSTHQKKEPAKTAHRGAVSKQAIMQKKAKLQQAGMRPEPPPPPGMVSAKQKNLKKAAADLRYEEARLKARKNMAKKDFGQSRGR